MKHCQASIQIDFKSCRYKYGVVNFSEQRYAYLSFQFHRKDFLTSLKVVFPVGTKARSKHKRLEDRSRVFSFSNDIFLLLAPLLEW